MADNENRELHPSEVARYEAEAAKFFAEAEIAKAQAEKERALAVAENAKAVKLKIDAEKAEREYKESLADDIHHHLYRFNGSVSDESVRKCIVKTTEWHREDPTCEIEVVFYSPGGSVIAGFMLFDHLRWLSAEGHHIVTGMTGMAASMAGILMQAGDHRWMSAESWYMIHRAAFGAAGKTFEIEDEVKWVKRIEARIIKIFVRNTNLTANKIKRNWERKDWWIESNEALNFGLVDEVRGDN